MRARLLVIGLFAAAVATQSLLAYHAGLFREPDVRAELTTSPLGRTVVTRLGWTSEPLGLAASRTMVVWERRGSPDGGLWSYDVRRRQTRRLLPASAAGRVAGRPRMAGPIIVWPARDRRGVLQVRALDVDAHRVWTAASPGTWPAVGGDTVAWIVRTARGDVIGAADIVTGERTTLDAGGRVQALAVWGGELVWGTGGQGHLRVWTRHLTRPGPRHLLAADASALAVDAQRTIWATPAGSDRAAIVERDWRTGISRRLCLVPGAVTSLLLAPGLVVWTDQTAEGPDIWACGLDAGVPVPVVMAPGDQVSPAVVGRTLFWADDRDGTWELCSRAL